MRIRYKLTEAAAFSPATLARLKRALRIEHTDQDTYLQELLDSAVEASQNETGRQYASAKFTAYLDSFPESLEMEIEKGLVTAITSVKYYAPGASVLTTLDSSKYELDNSDLTARLRFTESFNVNTEKFNPIQIELTCGWASAGAVPLDLVEAIILRATESYLHPDNQSQADGRITAANIKESSYKVQRY
jgi:uncharacterized phiE125 gp8 family phage protein